MRHKSIKYFCLCIALFASAASFAQQKSEAQMQKELYDFIEQQVDKYANSLNLEIAQVFFVDSILTHNYFALQDELKEMSDSGVGNTGLYQMVQDKWDEATYKAFEKVLNPDQWAKYLKTGASRDKKARDKRAAKRK